MTTDRGDGDLGAALEEPAFSGLLTELRDIAAGPAPAIGPDLAAVLAGAVPLAPTRARRSMTASAVVIGLVSTGVLAGGISAAAANELPAPVQRVVARVVNSITPFELPHPDRHGPPARVPDDGAPGTPVPSERDDVTSPPDISPSAPVGTGENTDDLDDELDDDRDEQGEGSTVGDDDGASDDPALEEGDEDAGEGDDRREAETGDAEDGDDGTDSGEEEADDRDGQD